jgi:hypothetical protein
MKTLVLAGLCSLALTGAADAAMRNEGLSGQRADRTLKVPLSYEKPAASYVGQHFTNSLGCTYSRTQAPGYPMVWHLQVNTRVPGCPNTIPGR